MINAIERVPIMQRDLVRMIACSNPWQQKLFEVANTVCLGRSDGPHAVDDITCVFLHNLSMLDHPSEWMGDHRYDSSRYVDVLTKLIGRADLNARLSNGRNLMDVLTAGNRYQLWKSVSEDIPDLAIKAFNHGANASPEAAKAMILPIYWMVSPEHIDYESDHLNSIIDRSALEAEVPKYQVAVKKPVRL
ncbi:hypothetical protein [Stenotrophomonas sp. NY11291]|uniref:hypothetical protein n=1 Tax=Stenotrophomonas sp. NY11291 TaxID=2939415 RepID=UPI00200CAD5D|nr:hypothetical protein [Stenotrophomonas sp. NY11291]UQA24430.1 hypothetical protein M1L61_09750 [Stenotrophomonas sp. NY11291]